MGFMTFFHIECCTQAEVRAPLIHFSIAFQFFEELTFFLSKKRQTQGQPVSQKDSLTLRRTGIDKDKQIEEQTDRRTES